MRRLFVLWVFVDGCGCCILSRERCVTSFYFTNRTINLQKALSFFSVNYPIWDIGPIVDRPTNMEKFAKWNDPANLVNPFAPTTIFPTCSLYLTGSILLIIRLPLLLITFTLLFIVSSLNTLPLGPVTKLLRYTLEAPLARLALLFLGYWSVSTSYVASNKLRVRKSKDPNKTRPTPVGSCVCSGDVVVCTATSPIEILWLTWMFAAPTFAHVVDTSSKSADPSQQTAAVESKGLFSSFTAFSSMRSVPKGKTPTTTTLKKLADSRKGGMMSSSTPVCTFPEGVRSNGTGVLMFHPIFEGLTFTDHRCHLLTFQHDQQKSSKFSATLPVGSLLKCFMWHCMHWSHSMKISMFPAQELVAPPLVESEEAMKAKNEAQVRREVAARASAGKYGGGILPSIAMPNAGLLGNRCRNLLAKMYGVDTLTRCSHDYDTFVEFWKEELEGAKKKK